MSGPSLCARKEIWTWTLAVLMLCPSSAAEEGAHSGEAFALYVENDSRRLGEPGSDQAYSSGVKLSFIYAEDHIPPWSRHLPDFKWTKVNFGLSLGQQLYTPNNTQVTYLLEDDRPYAAWLYLGLAMSLRESEKEDFLEVDFGLVGPGAYGNEVQNGFHRAIGVGGVRGWDYGLHDEPTIQVFYQRRIKAYRQKNLDFITFYGAGLGNVLIAVHAGGIVRLGVNLPDNFGPSRPSASDGDSFVSLGVNSGATKKSVYGFVGGRGNAIGRSLFLDGNTFRSSHRVKKYPFTNEVDFGVGIQATPWSVVWSFVTRSPEFEERSVFSSFASVTVIYLL